ncbi:hypothetical protein THRCLA_20695 [Thraustotheca clavata]|uniref:FYVE-type domain-containing protein n=1 Tax=Thraustotheca clavata TaxID=74557 RepID=A0A1W0A4H6_9STRA|nr:hypothetical protein THRCLA_20695 [Thraustotheca clavata]
MTTPLACGLCMQTFNLFHPTRYQCPTCHDVVCRHCSSTLINRKDQPRTERRICLRCKPVLLLKKKLVEEPRDVVAFLNSGGLHLQEISTPNQPSIDTDELDFNWGNPYPKAPVPENEIARLHVVERLHFYEHIGSLAKDTTVLVLLQKALTTTAASMAVIHLVDETHAYKVVASGFAPNMPPTRTPRLEALSSYVITSETTLVVPNTSKDLRFRAHPVAAEYHAMAFISVPIFIGAQIIGTLDLFSTNEWTTPVNPKTLTELATLATLASNFIQNTCKDATGTVRPRRKTAPAKIESEGSLLETMEALLTQSRRTSNYVQVFSTPQ